MDEARVRATQRRVEELAGEIDGVVGVAARDLASGAEVAVNADEPFPTASVMKVPILFELYRQAEAGQVDLDRRVPYGAAHRVPGSGVLQDLAYGLAPTVKDLATLMITVSDNTATDMVLDLVGVAPLNETIGRLGLTRTAIPFSTRGLLYSMVGLDPANPEHTYDLFLERSKAGQVDWGSRALADTSNNVSTPRDLNRLLELIERRERLSDASCAAMLDILKAQKYNTIIPLHLPAGVAVAHKTGSLRGVRNDVGIVYAPDGPYLLSLFAKRLSDQVAGASALAEISKAVWEGFVGPLPAPRYGPAPA
ncbi:MAG TPA: serine hydrolase [Thermomicrobiales bacterium]|nr:serine hydrolase [Thermomicrobiales bacterium]